MNQLLNIFAELVPEKINWEYVAKNYQLSDEFIERFSSYLNWDKISRYQSLSEKTLEKNIDKINWKFIAYKQSLSENFILKYRNELLPHKQSLTYGQKLSPDFIENNFSLIHTQELRNKHYIETLPFDFFLKNIERIPENIIKIKVEHDGISPDSYLMDYFGKSVLFFFKKVPEPYFIRNHLRNINWQWISETKQLEGNFTEDFIIEFCDKIKWTAFSKEIILSDFAIQSIIDSGKGLLIYKTQKVSIDFLKQHQEDIQWDYYAYNNPFINEEIINEFKDKIALKTLRASLTKENFSIDFIRKNKDELNWVNLTSSYFNEMDEAIGKEFEAYLYWEYVFNKDLEFSFMINHLDKIPSQGFLLRNIDNFSFEEIHQLKNHINWNHMGVYYKINDTIIDEFNEYVNWKLVSRVVKFNQPILEKYWNKLKWEYLATDRVDTSHLDYSPVINKVIQNNTFSRFPFLIYYNHRKYPIHF